MTADASAVIVLLAAGEARRFGSAKQLALIDGEPMVRRAARIAASTGAPVSVVTGAYIQEVEAALAGLPVGIVRNERWREGMGTSLAVGIAHLLRDRPAASGVLLCLADQPHVDLDLLHRLLHRHAQVPDRILAVGHADVVGPPVLFPRDLFAELAQWAGDAGAQGLLRRQAGRLEILSVTSMIDLDTPSDLQAWQDRAKS